MKMDKKYKEIQVELKGEGEGLLVHSAQGMMGQPTAKKNPAQQYDAAEEAEKVCYRNKDDVLYVPSRCVKGAILNAASWYKFGKKSAKPILAGGTRIEPCDILLVDDKGNKIKDYEIDSRPVVVQRNRIIRHRPLIREWNMCFTIVYNSDLIQDTDIIRGILEEAGQRIGLLDNRPQKYGENGMFSLTKFLPK